ncbi:MAG: glycosyltransferase family 2 protein [Flavobacteriales bacterium]|nr:glycosyltransferase family 2 protein [Flavobacteriales bacterium]
MKVTAIIVTYNGARWLHSCFGSLRASVHPVSVIAVDNGSTDGTPDLLRAEFPEVEVVQAPRNLGFGQGNNLGIRLALDRGTDHVFLLNQDAWVLPDTIGRLVHTASLHPELGVLSPIHLNGAGDAQDHKFARYTAPAKCPGLQHDLEAGTAVGRVYPCAFVNAAAWLVTRHCLLTVGGFDPAFFHYGEDDNYLHRVQHHGLRLGVVPDAVIHHDRAERAEDMRPAQRRAALVREVKLRFADPRSNADPVAERRALRRDLFRALLRLDLGQARVCRDHLAMLHEADVDGAVQGRDRARQPGPSFL